MSESIPTTGTDNWSVAPTANAASVFDITKRKTDKLWPARDFRRLITMARTSSQPTDLLADILKEIHTGLVVTGELDRRPKIGSAAVAQIIDRGGRKKLLYGMIGSARVSVFHQSSHTYELATLDDRLPRALLLPPTARPQSIAKILTRYQQNPQLQLTPDQALELASILDDHPDPSNQSPLAKMAWSERQHLLQLLGKDAVTPWTGQINVAPGDRVLLATNGLHDNLVERELKTILGSTDFRQVAAALVVRSQEVANSGSPRATVDDITAVVLEIL